MQCPTCRGALAAQPGQPINCDQCGGYADGQQNVGMGCRRCNFDVCPICFNAKKCPHGHNCEHQQHHVRWCCDGCRQTFNPYTLYSYRCEACDYDLCDGCAAPQSHVAPSPQPTPGNDDVLYPHTHTNINARCNKGHPITVTINPSAWRCDVCAQTFYDPKKVAALHCEPCDFDMCPNCAEKKFPPPKVQTPAVIPGLQCPQGHQLEVARHRTNWGCDGCRTANQPFATGHVLSQRCQKCDYDLCQHCWATATPSPQPHFPQPQPVFPSHPPMHHQQATVTNTAGHYRSLFIGINYVGSSAELRGCVNDVATMMALLNKLGYDTKDKRVYVDDSTFPRRTGAPDKRNLLDAFQWLVKGAKAGDTLFLHYSGHGSQMRDQDGDEDDGYDEALVPADYEHHGMIRDDDIFDIICRNLPKGVRLTAVMDCCHSGTLMDLEYIWVKDAPPRKKKDLSRGFEVTSKKHCDADVIMFSGCKDAQTSADVSSTSQFHHNLQASKAGGACTNSLAEVIMDELAHNGGSSVDISYTTLLAEMQASLKRRRFSQVPQLSTSKPIDVQNHFKLNGPI